MFAKSTFIPTWRYSKSANILYDLFYTNPNNILNLTDQEQIPGTEPGPPHWLGCTRRTPCLSTPSAASMQQLSPSCWGKSYCCRWRGRSARNGGGQDLLPYLGSSWSKTSQPGTGKQDRRIVTIH